jgi:hypothetical protein
MRPDGGIVLSDLFAQIQNQLNWLLNMSKAFYTTHRGSIINWLLLLAENRNALETKNVF